MPKIIIIKTGKLYLFNQINTRRFFIKEQTDKHTLESLIEDNNKCQNEIRI